MRNTSASPLAPHLDALNGQLSKLLDLMTEARVKVIANPLINITIQRRHDTYPKGRGVTRVKELMRGGLVVALGPYWVRDLGCSLGSGDMLEVRVGRRRA